MTSRRAVAPVIATLLLVAIAVVGGSIIFVFSQGFFSSAQISGSPQIESIKILGYDATDGNSTQFHDGVIANFTSGLDTSDGLLAGDYIAVYLKNDSVNKVTMSEIRLAGSVYTYQDQVGNTIPDYDAGSPIPEQGYTIALAADGGGGVPVGINSFTPEMEPGQHVTVLLSLDTDMPLGVDFQFLMTTTRGTIVVEMINMGSQSGPF